MALDGTNQYNVRNATVPSPCKSPGTDKCAIAEMRGPIRALGQGSQPGDNGANDLSSLIEQNTLRLDGSDANRCASALKSGELPLDVSTASNIAFDFTENSSEVAESLRQVTQTDRVTLEGDGQRIRHLADSFVGASAGLTGPGQARRGGDHERTEEGEPSQRASGAQKQGPHASSRKRPGSSRYLRVAASSATLPSAARPATEDKANEAGIARDYRAVSRRTQQTRRSGESATGPVFKTVYGGSRARCRGGSRLDAPGRDTARVSAIYRICSQCTASRNRPIYEASWFGIAAPCWWTRMSSWRPTGHDPGGR